MSRDEKIMERVSRRLHMEATWVNHGMVGSVLMIPVSKANHIVKEELEKAKK